MNKLLLPGKLTSWRVGASTAVLKNRPEKKED
jgi:hypothetical protein